MDRKRRAGGGDKWYKPGDYYVIDDIRGYKVRASHARLQWNNLLTAGSSFSPRQPQDLVVGVVDDQSVPLPRPRQPNRFTIVGTQVIAPAQIGDLSVTVESTEGFAVADRVQIMLDSGVPFQVVLSAVSSYALSWASPGLPSTVGVLYGDPPENAVINLSSGNF